MKLYVVLEVYGGVPNDPSVFVEKDTAIKFYLYQLSQWDQPECENGHKQFFPTKETFESFWDEDSTCVFCGEVWDNTLVGHDDDDLYFYDGIEVSE